MKLPFISREYILLWERKATPGMVLLNRLAHQQYERLFSTWENIVKNVFVRCATGIDF